MGSSEVPGWIIGKFQHVAGERGQHGLTGEVLSIAAMAGGVTIAAVQAALAEVTAQQLWQGCHWHLGLTVQGLCRRLVHALRSEQRQKPELVVNT